MNTAKQWVSVQPFGPSPGLPAKAQAICRDESRTDRLRTMLIGVCMLAGAVLCTTAWAKDRADGRCCNFLRVPYDELKAHVLSPAAPDDTAALAWAEHHGGARSDEECEIWNGFMMKRGWRDPVAELLAKRIAEGALEGKPIMTMFDCLDFDEGRDPVTPRLWET